MVILLLAATAILTGLLVDALRRLTAERAALVADEKHMEFLRAALRAAHEDTRAARRLADGWREHAAELETIAVVLAPREPAGLYPADAATEPRLRAVEGPGAFARAIARDPEIIDAAAYAGVRVPTGSGPEDRCGPMMTPDCPGCAESGTAGCALCCASTEPEGAA